jgi:predicted RNA-binding Zn-ribbon protein involved in translation (DUF1610 family)
MVDQWYFAWENNKFGPFSAAQLKELAGLGRLQPTDTVWKEGVEKGVLADKVKYLFPIPPGTLLLANGKAPVPKPFSSSIQPSNRLPSGPRHTPGKLQPLTTSTNYQVTPHGQLKEMIPDGLMLRVIPEENDPAFLLSPSPIHSPGAKPGSQENTSPTINQPSPKQKPQRQATAVGVFGVHIISQDGINVQFRKKCRACGFEDPSRTTLPIRSGSTRVSFFCPKCKKIRDGEIRGSRQ